MTIDTDKLKALALAANDLPDTTQPFVSSTGQVVIGTFSLKGEQLQTVGNFYDAANPATVLELIAEVERLRAASSAGTREKDAEWISVDEQLPPVGVEVLVYRPNSWRRKVTALTRFVQYEGAAAHYWDNDYPGKGNLHLASAVTHWRYMPDAAIEAHTKAGKEEV